MGLRFGTIEQTVFFEASPEEVYDALLDPKKHSEFTGSPATTSARKGATFTAWEGYITGKNLELVKGKKIVQEWKTTEWPDGYPVSRLELTLGGKKGGTELKMVHSKVPAEQVARLHRRLEELVLGPAQGVSREAPGEPSRQEEGEPEEARLKRLAAQPGPSAPRLWTSSMSTSPGGPSPRLRGRTLPETPTPATESPAQAAAQRPPWRRPGTHSRSPRSAPGE